MTNYIGILDGSGDVWGVRLPDLPGCYGCGKTADEAVKSAVTAAIEWVEDARAKSEAIPVPRSMDAIINSGEIDGAAGESTVAVPVLA